MSYILSAVTSTTHDTDGVKVYICSTLHTTITYVGQDKRHQSASIVAWVTGLRPVSRNDVEGINALGYRVLELNITDGGQVASGKGRIAYERCEPGTKYLSRH